MRRGNTLGLLDPLQARAEDEVEHRQKNEGQNGREEQPENVDRGERMPERAAGEEERKQTADRGQNGDEHGAETDQTGLNKRPLQRHSFGARFLDEIAQDNDVTDDDAGQTNDAKQGHETERRVRDREPEKGPDQA